MFIRNRQVVAAVTLLEPLQINTKQLKEYFSSTERMVTVTDTHVEVSGPKNGKIVSNEISSCLFYLSDKSIEGFRIFASSNIDSFHEEIKKLQDNDNYDDLKSTFKKLCNQLNLLQEKRLQEDTKEETLFKKYLMELKSNVSSINQNEPLWSGDATDDDIKKCMFIPEHGYTVLDFSDHEIYIGTKDLGSCTGFVAINNTNRSIALAHLDGKTLETYKNSMEEMFNLLHSNKEKTEVYLFQNQIEPGFYETVNIDEVNQKTILLSKAIMRTIALSVRDFINNREDAIFKGSLLLPEYANTAVIAKISRNKNVEFLNVSEKLLNFHQFDIDKQIKINSQFTPIYLNELMFIPLPNSLPRIDQSKQSRQEIKTSESTATFFHQNTISIPTIILIGDFVDIQKFLKQIDKSIQIMRGMRTVSLEKYTFQLVYINYQIKELDQNTDSRQSKYAMIIPSGTSEKHHAFVIEAHQKLTTNNVSFLKLPNTYPKTTSITLKAHLDEEIKKVRNVNPATISNK